MKIRIAAVIGLAVPLLVLPTSTFASTNTFLANLIAGTWKGKGTIRRTPDGQEELVRCKLMPSFHRGASVLTLRYICRGIDVSFETYGNLDYDGKTRTVSGWLSTVGMGSAKTTGQQVGNKVTMTMVGEDKKTGKPQKAVMTISLTGERTLQSTVVTTDIKTGKTFNAFVSTFTR